MLKCNQDKETNRQIKPVLNEFKILDNISNIIIWVKVASTTDVFAFLSRSHYVCRYKQIVNIHLLYFPIIFCNVSKNTCAKKQVFTERLMHEFVEFYIE